MDLNTIYIFLKQNHESSDTKVYLQTVVFTDNYKTYTFIFKFMLRFIFVIIVNK